jgi:hypothetical protein
MKASIVMIRLLSFLVGISAAVAYADGDPAPTYQRERAVQRYKGCHWTDEMGKYVYECIKRNDGFSTHWCYDETLESFCPAQLEAGKQAAPQSVGDDKSSR